jgi:hypothetical protein
VEEKRIRRRRMGRNSRRGRRRSTWKRTRTRRRRDRSRRIGPDSCPVRKEGRGEDKENISRCGRKGKR